MATQTWQKHIEFKITYRILLIDMWVEKITAWEMEITT